MKYLFYLSLFTLPVISGCTPEVPPPPVERNDLVVRFFRSLRNNSTDSAIMQGEKLYVMDYTHKLLDGKNVTFCRFYDW